MLRFKYCLLLILVGGCYPISVNHTGWKIKYDKEMIASKEQFLVSSVQNKKNPPNIILIVCDALGKYEVSAYGSDHVGTPQIDQIAS